MERKNVNSLHQFSGPDGFSGPDELPPALNDTMTLDEALVRVAWLLGRERATGRKQTDRNAQAIELALTAMQNSLDREPREGEHEHVCGVPSCGNAYRCGGARCAGAVWTCPACQLDELDKAIDGGRL